MKGLFEYRQYRTGRTSRPELGLGPPLVENPRVIEAFVGIFKMLEYPFGLPVPIRPAAGELISEGKPEKAMGKLMVRFGGQDVAADRLGFFRFVKGTIQFSLRNGFRDAAVEMRLSW